jgi:hypothetical protein
MSMSGWMRRCGAVCLFALAASITGCGGGGGGGTPPPVDPPPPVPATGSVSGLVVTSATGEPMAGASARVGALSAVTGADGRFTLNGVAPGQVVVALSAAGHAGNFANATVVANQAAAVSTRLTPLGATAQVNAASGGTVTVPDSPAQVVLPAAGIATAAGAAYSGTVTVDITPIDPASDPGNMPGDLTTRAGDGSVQPIESFGALAVTLRDPAGNRLNLAAGSSATIRIPLATRAPNPPASIPLFWFNETTGLWVQEGSATLAGTAPARYYEGTVTHFTFWNADQIYNTITVNGCVQDSTDARVAGAQVRSDGLDYSGRDRVLTDTNGNFSVAMRRGSRAAIEAESAGRTSNAVIAGPSETSITLPTCLRLGNGTPVFIEQPQAQSVTEGGFAVFRALARGSAPLRYQWQRNGVDLPGATATILIVDPARNEDNGASYRVRASNDVGATNSQAATLTVAQLPPLIIGQPQALTVAAGSDAVFSVQVAAQGAPLTFQWLRNNQVIPGATAASYTLAAAQLADSGASFAVRVSNAVGQVVSSAAQLVVTPVAVAPAITSQPQPVTVFAGQAAQFSVGASGSAPLSYVWRRGGTVIEGAGGATLTLPATTLADSGAQFSVVVSNSAGSATSAAATLTVNPAAPSTGHHLVASQGVPVGGAIVFANGSQSHQSAALVAVPATNPGAGAITVEAAGAATEPFATLLEASISGNQISGTRERYSFYFKDGRLRRLDHVASSGPPTSQIVSALSSADICGEGGSPALPGSGVNTLIDLADASRSWLLLVGPGTDGQCFTPDDTLLAVRADMAGSTAARVLVGEPLLEVFDAGGALGGVILRQGQQLRRLDAQLANPVTVHTLSGTGPFQEDFVFGSALPGIWLFVDNGRLWGLRLDGTGPAQELATFTEAERQAGHWRMTSQGGSAYVAIAGQGASRVLRVDGSLAVTASGSGPADFSQLLSTPTRLVFESGGTVSTQPLGGGTRITVVPSTVGSNIAVVFIAGENLYVPSVITEGNFIDSAVFVVGSDGSNPQTLPGTAVVAVMVPPVAQLSALLDEGFHALTLAQGGGLAGEGGFAGATLRTLLGATRQTLVTHGTLPTDPDAFWVFPTGLAPFHYGQPGLLGLFALEIEATDLLHFVSDAVGITRVTQTGATPSSAALRPQALASHRAALTRVQDAAEAAQARQGPVLRALRPRAGPVPVLPAQAGTPAQR